MIERDEIDGVTVVRLANGKVNALDLDLCRAITDTFRGLVTDGSTAIVFTGKGSSFSAGVDLWRILDGGPTYVDEFVPALVDAFEAVFDLPKPVVAAINGHAIAGGCVLACGADYRLLAGGGIGVPEGLVGVPFPAAALEIVTDAIGPIAARRAVTTGQIYRAEEALAAGLVDALVAAEDLLDVAVARARHLATAVPPDTFAVTKRQLRAATRRRIAALAADFDDAAIEIWRQRSTDGWIADYMAQATGRGR